MGSFYKGFPWKNFFTRKSFVNFFPIFKLESDFFPHFLSKIRNLENCENLFSLNFIWANFEQNQSKFFSKKRPIFQLGIGFFSNFPNKIASVPKYCKFIYSELHFELILSKIRDSFFFEKFSLFSEQKLDIFQLSEK